MSLYEEFIIWGMAPLPDEGEQQSVGKELSIVYKFNYQATSSFSVKMNYSFGVEGNGTLSNLVGSIFYTSVDTQQTQVVNWDGTLSSFTQKFPSSSFCSVVMVIQGDCDTYGGVLNCYLS